MKEVAQEHGSGYNFLGTWEDFRILAHEAGGISGHIMPWSCRHSRLICFSGRSCPLGLGRGQDIRNPGPWSWFQL